MVDQEFNGSFVSKPMRLGVMGAGRMASKMADCINAMKKNMTLCNVVQLVAVATHDDLKRAQQFAREHTIPRAYGSYEAMLADPNVDIVYIATPHSLHEQHALMALEAGKAVLLEKSFALSQGQAQRILDVAHERQLYCGEAMWTRYMPSEGIMLNMLRNNAERIGSPRALTMNISYPTSHKPRIVDARLGGGALLDVGVYAVNFADMMFPEATIVHRTAHAVLENGVDTTIAFTQELEYEGSRVLVNAVAGTQAASDRSAVLMCERGYAICDNINCPKRFAVYDVSHEKIDSVTMPTETYGYEYELLMTAMYLEAGYIEPPSMPHDTTLAMMGEMDRIREIAGIRFPDVD